MKRKYIFTIVAVTTFSMLTANCFARLLPNDYNKPGQVIVEDIGQIEFKLISKEVSKLDKTIPRVTFNMVDTQVTNEYKLLARNNAWEKAIKFEQRRNCL